MRAALLALLLASCAGECGAVGHGSIGTASVGHGAVGRGAVGGAHGAAAAEACDIEEATGLTPVLHYAARLESYANNDPVTSMTDNGSTGDDISQGTGAAQPTFKSSGPGGQPYLSFDGGDFLESTSAITLNLTTFSICCVVNAGAALTNETAIADDATTSRAIFSTASYAWTTNFGVTVNNGTSAINTWVMGCSRITAGAGGDDYWIDGVQVSTTDNGANDLDRARLGTNSAGANYRTGAIAECAVFDSAALDVDLLEAEWESAECYGNNFPFAGTP